MAIDVSAVGDGPDDASARASERMLVFGYFFTTWNARADAWALSLFLSLLFPDTLLPISIYAFVGSCACLVFGPIVGWVVDRSPRLRLASTAVVLQKLLICVSALLLLAKSGWTLSAHVPPHLALDWYFYVLVANGSALQVINLISRIAMERDWSSCIAAASDGRISLTALNARLRRLDLACDLAAPIAVSAVTSGANIHVGMLFVLGVSAVSAPLEWSALGFVHQRFPSLGAKADHSDQGVRPKLSAARLRWLWRLPVTTTCLSISVLYLSVMTINTVSVAYLLSRHAHLMLISAARGVSVISGVLATETLPWLVPRLGLKPAGLVGLWSQAVCLAVVVASFYADADQVRVGAFLLGICLSRWGLWTFDLVQQQLLQEGVPGAYLGLVSGAEISLQNLFQMGAYALTMVWAAPRDFWIPAHISGGAVLVAALTYSAYVGRRDPPPSPTEPLLDDVADPRRRSPALDSP